MMLAALRNGHPARRLTVFARGPLSSAQRCIQGADDGVHAPKAKPSDSDALQTRLEQSAQQDINGQAEPGRGRRKGAGEQETRKFPDWYMKLGKKQVDAVYECHRQDPVRYTAVALARRFKLSKQKVEGIISYGKANALAKASQGAHKQEGMASYSLPHFVLMSDTEVKQFEERLQSRKKPEEAKTEETAITHESAPVETIDDPSLARCGMQFVFNMIEEGKPNQVLIRQKDGILRTADNDEYHAVQQLISTTPYMVPGPQEFSQYP